MGSAHLSWLGHGHHSHDHAHSADDALRDSAAGIQAVKISLVVLGLTAVAQLAIVAASGRSDCSPTPCTTSPTR